MAELCCSFTLDGASSRQDLRLYTDLNNTCTMYKRQALDWCEATYICIKNYEKLICGH
jgi:hypothetical protein